MSSFVQLWVEDIAVARVLVLNQNVVRVYVAITLKRSSLSTSRRSIRSFCEAHEKA